MIYFILGWLCFSVMTYRAYAKHMWGSFGDVLGWRWTDTLAGVTLALFSGPIGLLALLCMLDTWVHRKAEVPVKPRLPRNPAFHKYYTGEK